MTSLLKRLFLFHSVARPEEGETVKEGRGGSTESRGLGHICIGQTYQDEKPRGY